MKSISPSARSIGRRAFSAAAVSSVAAPLLSRRALAFESADVIVIGAGLAGLNAALNLEAEGLSVIVLEAADYVGGRTRTLDLPVGPTNAGGQTVGPYYARLRDLVSRLDVPLISVPPTIAMGNYVNGSLVSSGDWQHSTHNKTSGVERSVQPAALEFFYLSRNNPLPDPGDWTDGGQSQYDVPLQSFLQSKGASEEAIRLINISINAPSLSSCSALAYLRDIKLLQWGMADRDNKSRTTYGATNEEGFKSHEIAGGTQRLPEAMAAALKGEVRLNQAVGAIDLTEHGAEVRTLDGSRFKGKYAISAVPFSALRNVDVYPNFTGDQLDAVRQSAHGNTVRVFIEFKQPFWEADIGEPGLFTDTSIERVFARANEAGEIYTLDCWVNGNAADRLDQLPAETVGKFVIDTLARIRPSTKDKLRVLKVHSWAKHSASGCCRHVYDAGQVGRWAAVMAKPLGRLHLAGEQTRTIENGMEAAATTGERAALEIIERES